MAVWIVRAGGHGEFETKFLGEKRVYVTWDRLDVDVGRLASRDDLSAAMNERYPNTKPAAIRNWVSQVWPFAHEMQSGDLVVVPLKAQRAIQIGEVTGGYTFHGEGPNPFYHSRTVKWVGEAVPRDHFGKDLLFTFGAFLTICRVQRNNAEARIRAMMANGWKAEKAVVSKSSGTSEAEIVSEDSEGSDVEDLASDQIADLILARFKGHGLTRLVEGILKAQGYTTYRSPEGADGGADILAGAGPLGFGAPRLCVEVKSQDKPIDRPTVDKLLGAVTKFGAQEGLFVSWSGFKETVQKELAASFFRVRLWSQKDLLEQLFENYDRLDADLRAELPLKRIWIVASQDYDS